MSQGRRVCLLVAACLLNAAPARSQAAPERHKLPLSKLAGRIDSGEARHAYCFDVERAGVLYVQVKPLDGAPVAASLFEDGGSNLPENSLTTDYASGRIAVLEIVVSAGKHTLLVWNSGLPATFEINAGVESVPSVAAVRKSRDMTVSKDQPPEQDPRAARVLETAVKGTVGEGATYSARWYRALVKEGFTAEVIVERQSGQITIALYDDVGRFLRNVKSPTDESVLKLSAGEYQIRVSASSRQTASFVIYTRTEKRKRINKTVLAELPSSTAEMMVPDHPQYVITGGETGLRWQWCRVEVRVPSNVTLDMSMAKATAPAKVMVLDGHERVIATFSTAKSSRYSRKVEPGVVLLRIESANRKLSTIRMTVHIAESEPSSGFIRKKP